MQEPMPFDGTRMISGGFSAPARRARRRVANRGVPMKKNTICLWYDHDAEEAARFYARTFPDSTVGAVHRAPSDFPGGKAGAVLTAEFSACGWCKDKWGLSWQITPRVLTEALARGGDGAKRAFEAMMEMRKIDVARIEAAVRGEAVPA